MRRSDLPMKYRGYAVLFLVAGMIIGSIPPVFYHVLTIPPSIPPSPWDTRACAYAPSSAACDGKFPYAPNDLVNSQKQRIPGNGACISADARILTTATISAPSPIGSVDLWWAPRCQSLFAHVHLLIDAFLDLEAE